MQPPALAIAFELRRFDGSPLAAYEDPRRAKLGAVALAWERDGESHGAWLPLEGDANASLRVLASLWNDDERHSYIVFHRAQTACAILHAAGCALPTRVGCVSTAATLLAAGADGYRDDRRLEDCARDALGIELPAMEVASARLWREAELLIPLMRAYTPRLRETHLTRIYETECRILPSVVAMESAGMPVDGAALERVAGAWVRELGEDPPPDAKRRKRLEKLISTYRYWPRDYIDVDGRMRCRLNPLATDSGRFSCSEPNLQQVPSEHTAPGMRACFRPAEGFSFIVADYAQIELRVAAQLAPCEALRRVFREGRDVHRQTAATLSRKPPEQVSARERQLAKAVNFGFLFGMGAKRFRSYAKSSYGLELSDAQASAARDAFFRTFPGIHAWHRRVGALGHGPPREIEVRTALGRIKRFDAGEFSFNAALNIPVQGTAAEGFKLAMAALGDALPALGGRGVLVVHDEYIAEVPTAQAEAARELVIRLMRDAMAQVVPDLPIEVDAAIAASWAEK